MATKDKVFLMFIFSYSPFICILLLAIFILILLSMSIVDQFYILQIDMHRFLVDIFEPIVFTLFILTIFISLSVLIYFWNDISRNKQLSNEDKRNWKKLYFKISLFANSFYYEFKYNRNEPSYFLEKFFQKSRNSMFSHIQVPDNDKQL